VAPFTDNVNVTGQRQRLTTSARWPSMTERACLPEPPLRLLDGHVWLALAFSAGEGGVVLTYSSRVRVIGHVEQGDGRWRLGAKADKPVSDTANRPTRPMRLRRLIKSRRENMLISF
jgi:hypothetical protein